MTCRIFKFYAEFGRGALTVGGVVPKLGVLGGVKISLLTDLPPVC